MEHFAVEQRDDSLHILDIPDAVLVIRLQDRLAVKMAHLALHQEDLRFAQDCLAQINLLEHPTIRRSLWESAVTHLIKCFDTTSRRTALDSRRIYGADKLATEAFEYFKSLRNKHLVHDENAYAQAIPCAAINDGNKGYKTEKILSMTLVGETLEQDNYSNLFKLISDAQTHVTTKFEELCGILTKMLEEKSYNELLAYPHVEYRPPTIKELHERRLTPW